MPEKCVSNKTNLYQNSHKKDIRQKQHLLFLAFGENEKTKQNANATLMPQMLSIMTTINTLISPQTCKGFFRGENLQSYSVRQAVDLSVD